MTIMKEEAKRASWLVYQYFSQADSSSSESPDTELHILSDVIPNSPVGQVPTPQSGKPISFGQFKFITDLVKLLECQLPPNLENMTWEEADETIKRLVNRRKEMKGF